MIYRGLTWDHPRGLMPLIAAADRLAAATGIEIRWDVQPLEGFEAAPIVEIAEEYDLIVLDHPHLGEAVQTGSLQPIDQVLGGASKELDPSAFVGPSVRSYQFEGRLWALPLDAATQVSAVRADLGPMPDTWTDAVAASSALRTMLCLGGPHGILMALSIALAEGAEPDERGAVPLDRLRDALELIGELAAKSLPVIDVNPIRVLDRMAAGEVDYCPLLYQYVNYALPGAGHRVRFSGAPRGGAGVRGSVIGGTGLAVSRRCEPSPELIDHLCWLVSPSAQTRFIPRHEGQPARSSAWTDDGLNDSSLDFYRGTLPTIEQSWVRPCHVGFPRLQNVLSAHVRAVARREARAAEAAATIIRTLEKDGTNAH
ncbi:carbohydrate ABC transporter substrate-binding protein, CUT1 family [Paramicrobacterium humi]|uniref:Carbohydrate ABC transporter substrate-binding protein, CUT1 family n=1 Tax=Paramicrobacterium humi TaxID=640635 RepID=A0A1H4K9C4_9MICO|nr:extracellular solute-binding protein [Microbacterium humi]SEB55144.1 carbohydrate ABC transporter substrate-binding protein, CUT1 family [Microbacterium humi]